MSIREFSRRNDGRSRSKKRHHRSRSTGQAVHPSGTLCLSPSLIPSLILLEVQSTYKSGRCRLKKWDDMLPASAAARVATRMYEYGVQGTGASQARGESQRRRGTTRGGETALLLVGEDGEAWMGEESREFKSVRASRTDVLCLFILPRRCWAVNHANITSGPKSATDSSVRGMPTAGSRIARVSGVGGSVTAGMGRVLAL
ncbi:hypothetical protein J3F83DRAFT_43885 [Trichoderma novae-zelandiae]